MAQVPAYVYISPGFTATATGYCLVFHPNNPDNFPGGWCYFYGIRGHLAKPQAYQCGAYTTASLQSGFCMVPAPVNYVGYNIIHVLNVSHQDADGRELTRNTP